MVAMVSVTMELSNIEGTRKRMLIYMCIYVFMCMCVFQEKREAKGIYKRVTRKISSKIMSAFEQSSEIDNQYNAIMRCAIWLFVMQNKRAVV